MTRYILRFGILAGLIVVLPMLVMWLRVPADGKPPGGMVESYLIMLVALSMVFVGIKQYRDRVLGGVIRFVPALLLGLGISIVASLLYVAGWEICMAFGKFDFSAYYAKLIVESAHTAGADAAGIAKANADAQEFVRSYANPRVRMAYTFIEIFPVGVLVSLISAALLRNSRLLPARPVSTSTRT
jgi:hypothetical protein